jgi:ubiquinone/menaquinone biosynthesis C-methylase UbiE
MDQSTAQAIMAKNQAEYTAMAAAFSRTRGNLPPDLLALGEYIIKGEKVLDLGCGNGRFSELVAPEDYLGADACEALIKIAQGKYPDKIFFPVEALQLPFPDHSFDKIFCLAVIHHLPSEAYRRIFLGEIKRVLRPGGKLILTSWYLLDKPKQLLKLGKLGLLKFLGANHMDLGDIFVPFKSPQGEILANRYFHAFSLRGLKKLVAEQNFSVTDARLIQRGKNRNIQIVANS